MEDCLRDDRCLICRRLRTLKNSEKLISNATLLQDFLNCFHINLLDRELNDLSTSCQFCRTCEQFLVEWSSIQTQMTQLTRRAAQLKGTLSALLLSAAAPEIEKQNHSEKVTAITNKRKRNSQGVQLPLLLQQTVDDIRNELRKRYLPNVMLSKVRRPCTPRSLNQEQFAPFAVPSGDDVQPMTLDCPNRLNYKGTSFQRNGEDQPYTCDACRFKSGPTLTSIQCHINDNHVMPQGICGKKTEIQPAFIPFGPKRFKYGGYDVKFNADDRCYCCGMCNYRGHYTLLSTINHIRQTHFTLEDLVKYTAVRRSDTEWLYGGKYQIIKVDNKFQCVSCGSVRSTLQKLVSHIKSKHVELEGSEEVVPLPDTDVPSVNVSTPDSVDVASDKNQVAPVVKLEHLAVDDDNVDELWDHWECAASTQVPVLPKIEPSYEDPLGT